MIYVSNLYDDRDCYQSPSASSCHYAKIYEGMIYGEMIYVEIYVSNLYGDRGCYQSPSASSYRYAKIYVYQDEMPCEKKLITKLDFWF